MVVNYGNCVYMYIETWSILSLPHTRVEPRARGGESESASERD